VFSAYDQANFSSLLCGHGDWFHAELARLIAHADSSNREKLRQGFPEEVSFFEQYAYGDATTALRAVKTEEGGSMS
jgi:hypothetical protein